MTVRTRGEGNVLLVPSIIANEALMRLINSLIIPQLADFTYDQYFSRAIGDQITILLPYYAFINRGRVLDPANINPMVDRSITVQVGNRWNFPLKWNDEEKTLDITDFGDRYLDSGIEQLGYQYDQAGGYELATASHIHSGVPGTEFTQDLLPFIRSHAEEVAIPSDENNFGIINPHDSATLSKDLGGAKGESGKFVSEMVKSAIERRFVGDLQEFRIFRSIHMPNQEILSPAGVGTPQVNGANQTGDTLNTDTWGVNATKVLKKGSLITIAGVYEVYPRSYTQEGATRKKLSTGRLKTFTVTEDVTTSGAGAAAIKISPEINDGTLTQNDKDGNAVSLKAFQNVDAAPADNAVITVVGRAAAGTNKTYRTNMFYHRKALQYIPIILSSARSAVHQYTAVEPSTNINVQMTQFFDGLKMEETLRADILFAVKNVYPELCIRQLSSAVN